MQINGIQKLNRYSIQVNGIIHRIRGVQDLTDVSTYPTIERICRELKHQPGFIMNLYDWYEAPIYAFVSYDTSDVVAYVWVHVVLPFDKVFVKKVRWDMVKTPTEFLNAFSEGSWAESDMVTIL